MRNTAALRALISDIYSRYLDSGRNLTGQKYDIYVVQQVQQLKPVGNTMVTALDLFNILENISGANEKFKPEQDEFTKFVDETAKKRLHFFGKDVEGNFEMKP